jgi:hypothetical protein
LNLNGMVPLPPHEDAERSMAFSMLLKYALTRPDGTPTNFSGIVTATFVHAKGKLLFLYANGGDDDLQWSRTVSHDWAAALLAANPSDAATLVLERKSSGGFDWNQLVYTTLVGGGIGGLIGLIRYLWKQSSA